MSGSDLWPTSQWAVELDPMTMGVDAQTIATAAGELFDHGIDPAPGRGVSLALVVVHRGHIVAEHYGAQPGNAFHDARAITKDVPLISWSMAKSITHALLGTMVDDGMVSIGDRVPMPEWHDDDRRDITWRDLLQMRDGLDFVEDYVVDPSGESRSDVIDMLFGTGADDVFDYARSRSLIHRPGTRWSYSSGTTNIVCGLIDRVLGGREKVDERLRTRIFEPLGMSSAKPTFDAAGTFIGSSYVHATAQDFAKFGYLYLRRGTWGDRTILSPAWVEAAHDQHVVDPDNGHGYSQHWWTWNADPRTCAALGYEGQRTIVVPERDAVIVHLGKWETATQPFLDSVLTRVIEAIPRSWTL